MVPTVTDPLHFRLEAALLGVCSLVRSIARDPALSLVLAHDKA